MSEKILSFTEEDTWGKLHLTGEAFYSMDNTICHLTYLCAKRYMEEQGDDQLRMYKDLVRKYKDKPPTDDVDEQHRQFSKDAVKIFKKIRDAIAAIDEFKEFDVIRHPKIREHVDVIWRFKGILWF